VTSVALVDPALTLCSQRLQFAGQSVLLKTNSPTIAQHAVSFLTMDDGTESNSADACATITVHLRESDEPCESAPWFRARGHFAFARFTRCDSFWFNLRTREVYGTCTPRLAEDSRRWSAHIFPALLGILSAAIGVAPIHAGCLARDGRGVLLTGNSGAGKSTLAIALARRGYALLSDEWTYLAGVGQAGASRKVFAWGLPVPIKLLPDASRFFPELLSYAPNMSLNGEVAYEVWPDECFGVLRQMRSCVNTIVLLEQSRDPGCRFTRISAAEGTEHLSAALEPLEGPLAGHYKRQLQLIQHLAHASCLRLSFNGHPDDVAEALDDAVSEMR
jgi:hypothetical protein